MKASTDGLYQPDYLAFGGAGARTEAQAPPAVHILADRDEAGKIMGSGPEFPEVEASRIANLIRQMHDSGDWLVAGGGTWHPPCYGDIAVLMPVLTRADVLEDSLIRAGIPFVLEGGKFYFARSEVSAAVTALSAIANPNDSIATYGALRSIFFGLSDEDLLRARLDGHVLDFREPVSRSSPLFRPYEVLRELHQHRLERPASETYATLLRETGAREVLAARGLQSVANLAKLGRTLRALEPGRTFSETVMLLDSMDEEGIAEQESRMMEERSDAVRVLSIHKAKGLDYPIVIVAGLGRQKRARRDEFLADTHGLQTFGIRVKCSGRSIETPGWDRIRKEDEKREEAELVRLLYVALTRARDHLVLSAHTRGTADGEMRLANTRLQHLENIFNDPGLEEEGLARFVDVTALDRQVTSVGVADTSDPKRLQQAYEDECACLDRTLAKAGPAPEPGRMPDEDIYRTARARAIRLGLAFHDAMEQGDLGRPEHVADLARECGIRLGLDTRGITQLTDMVERTLSSPVFDQVRTAQLLGGRIIRELPVIRAIGDSLEETRIDLLFQGDQGWVLVDYKTDDVAHMGQELLARHSHQVLGYREALKSVGIPVSRAYLLYARTGALIEV